MKRWSELSKGRKYAVIGLAALIVFFIYVALLQFTNPEKYAINKPKYVSKEGYDLLATCKHNAYPVYVNHTYLQGNNTTLMIECKDIHNNSRLLFYNLEKKTYLNNLTLGGKTVWS
jgi:hypothetical protein